MAVFFNDTFTEASTTLLTAHTSNSGHTWSGFAGNLTTAPSVYTSFGGVVGAGVATPASVWRASVLSPTADVSVSSLWYVDAVAATLVFGPCARLNAAGTAGYAAVYVKDSTAWLIVRIGASLATTTLATSSTVTYVTTNTPSAELIVTGSGATVTLELKVGGSTLLTTTDTSGSRITAAGYPGFWMDMTSPAQGTFLNSMSADDLAVADTTAPTLTGATGTATGSTTATGSVTTDEANGTLYRLASTNATETAATVIAAALSQTVTATGAQAVTFTGLTASTTYYAHYVHVDAAANQSTRVSSASFTTTTPDTTGPDFGAATLNAGTKTSTSVALSTSAAATDAVGVTGYEWSSDNGATYPFTSLTNSFTFTALTALTSYNFRVRAYDAAGNRSTHLALTTSTYRAGDTAANIIANTAAVGGNPAGHMYALALTLPSGTWMSYRTISGPTPSGGTLTEYANGNFEYFGPDAAIWTTQAELNGVDHTETTIITLYDQTVRVAASFGLAWSVRNYVDTSKSLAWSVRNLVATAKTMAWSVRNLVATSFTLAWSVDGGEAPEVSTLIVEDGTAKADADSYISQDDADDYFSKRGNAAWDALTVTQKDQALRRATDYMCEVYRTSWAGYRKTDTQALDWPRYEVPRIDSQRSFGYGRGYTMAYYDESSVPAEVKRACAELAVRAAAGELAPDVGRLVQREKVDVLEVEYAEGASPYTRYRAIDNMLRPFLGGRPNQIRLVRS